MNHEVFNDIFEEQVDTCRSMLTAKAAEYADEDRLHNFKNAAMLANLTESQALAGMLAKHTVSVYDMVWDDKEHPMEVWNEKITDHINYLFLLKAIVVEKQNKKPRVRVHISDPGPNPFSRGSAHYYHGKDI